MHFPTTSLEGLQILQEYKGVKILKCHSIAKRIKAGQGKEVKEAVAVLLAKTCILLGIDMGVEKLEMFTVEIIETYGHDSVEDIRQALVNGRRAGVGHAKRGVFSMEIVEGWMKDILDRKSQLREQREAQESAQARAAELEEMPEIDYKAYKKRLDAEKEKNSKLDHFIGVYNPQRKSQIIRTEEAKRGEDIIKKHKS